MTEPNPNLQQAIQQSDHALADMTSAPAPEAAAAGRTVSVDALADQVLAALEARLLCASGRADDPVIPSSAALTRSPQPTAFTSAYPDGAVAYSGVADPLASITGGLQENNALSQRVYDQIVALLQEQSKALAELQQRLADLAGQVRSLKNP